MKWLWLIGWASILFLSGCNTSQNKAIELNNQWIDLHASQDFAGALEQFDAALAIDPGIKEAYYNKGLAYIWLGENRLALEQFDAALAIDPNYTDALWDKWLALSQLGEFDEALAYYDTALERSPNDPNILNNKWFTWYKMWNYSQAIYRYDEALAVNPRYSKALANKWVATADSWDLLGSLAYFDQAIEINPDNYLTIYNKATVLSDLWFQLKWSPEGEAYTNESLDLLNTVILQNHDFKDAYVYIAINYIDLWKYQDAISYTDSILENDPEYENALFYKWKALKWLWNNEEALAVFIKVLEINPNNAYASSEYDELTK